MNIDNAPIEEWLAPLKKYQRENFQQLVRIHGVEEAAKLWISAQGPSSLLGFGGGKSDPQPFYDRFMGEFRKFICGDSAYERERQQLEIEGGIIKAVCISTISAALGSTLGFAATILAPAVAAGLYLVGRMGINAWCEVD